MVRMRRTMGMKWAGIAVILALLAPVGVVQADHLTKRVCLDPLDADVVSVDLYFRTSETGNATAIRRVPVGNFASDTVKCFAPRVGVLIATLNLPEHDTNFLAAASVDANNHVSSLTEATSGTPFPFVSTTPGAPTGVEVR